MKKRKILLEKISKALGAPSMDNFVGQCLSGMTVVSWLRSYRIITWALVFLKAFFITWCSSDFFVFNNNGMLIFWNLQIQTIDWSLPLLKKMPIVSMPIVHCSIFFDAQHLSLPVIHCLTRWLTILTNVTLRMSRHRDPLVCYASLGSSDLGALV